MLTKVRLRYSLECRSCGGLSLGMPNTGCAQGHQKGAKGARDSLARIPLS